MSRSVAFASTLAVGALIGLQPAANAALARHVGNLGAALISGVVAVTLLALLLIAFGDPRQLSGLSGFKIEYAIGGIGGAMVVLVGLMAVRPLGVAGTVSLFVTGQLLISVLADRLGWFGVVETGLRPQRVIGILLVICGTVLITRL